MCGPLLVLAGLAAGATIYGAVQQGNAAKDQKRALVQQNAATTQAQNEGFTSRLKATDAQTLAQLEAYGGTLEGQNQVAGSMRAGQNTALDTQRDLLDTVNRQEGALHDVGMWYGNNLLDQTSGDKLAQAQLDWQDQAAHLLDDSNVPAFRGGDTGTSDAETNAALARRAAEAAGNIRAYGRKAAQVSSYTAPLQLSENAALNTATGIMPAEQSSKLLQASMPVLSAPAQTAWGNATSFGNAAMDAVKQAGIANQNIAGLQYTNSTDIANLRQSDLTQVAANVAAQAKADADYKAAMGQLIQGIGMTGLQAAGYYGAGGAGDTFGNLFKTAATGPVPGVGAGDLRSFSNIG